jgi:acetyl-CoA acetyltransferase
VGNISKLRNKVAIVGVGETIPVRRSEVGVKTMIMLAIQAALDDAGMAADEIDGIVHETNVVPSMMTYDEVASNLGLQDRVFSASMGGAGAGMACAPMLAAMAIDAGIANTVLCYFGVDWGSNKAAVYGWHGVDPYKKSLEMPYNFYGQPVYFAAWAQRYMHEYGMTQEQLAEIPLAARAWAQLHPYAQVRTPLDMDGYLQSPVISDPLRALDCCLLTDGAGAFIMTSAERARDYKKPPVYAAGFSYNPSPRSQHSDMTQKDDFLSTRGKVSAPRALAMAGVDIKDVDFAEIYDCFSITTLVQIEDLGFCKKGEGASFIQGGRIRPGGETPVNTHGGLLSHAYTLGVNHMVEAVRQLRHEVEDERQVKDAEVGIFGGYGMWEHATLVLTR